MSKTLTPHSGTGVVVDVPGVGILLAYGPTVPQDNDDGYATGCLFIHTDGSTGTALYCNEGDVENADFDAVTVA